MDFQQKGVFDKWKIFNFSIIKYNETKKVFGI